MRMLDWLTPDVAVLIAIHVVAGAITYMVFRQIWDMD